MFVLAFFSPLCLLLTVLQIITITNYTGEARQYLKCLIIGMGATFTKTLSSSNTIVIAALYVCLLPRPYLPHATIHTTAWAAGRPIKPSNGQSRS